MESHESLAAAAGPPVIHSSRRIPELDGVRGLAILLVLVYHYAVAPLDPGLGPTAGFFKKVLVFGWSGVDLFFVLSGFLIGGILLDNREEPGYFKAFYARRVCRIFPLYFAWLLLTTAVLAAASRWPGAAGLEWLFSEPLPLWTYFLFVQNIAVSAAGQFGGAWLAPTWSLAVEEQFYFLLPFLIRFVAPGRLPFVLAGLALLAPALRALVDPFGQIEAYVAMPCRMDSLMLGVLLAWVVRRDWGLRWLRRSRPWLYGALALLLGGMLLFQLAPASGFSFFIAPYLYTWLALIYGLLLALAVVEGRGPASALTRLRPLRRLGGLAYGVYIFHQPVNALLHGLLLGRPPHLSTPAELAVTLAALAATLGIAVLSWKLFEKPILALGQAVPYRPADGAVLPSPTVVAPEKAPA